MKILLNRKKYENDSLQFLTSFVQIRGLKFTLNGIGLMCVKSLRNIYKKRDSLYALQTKLQWYPMSGIDFPL